MSISEFDKGWIIGFIEGEGSFTFDAQGGRAKKNGEKRPIPRLSVTQTCKAPLEFLQKFFSGGHIYRRSFTGKMYWEKYNNSPRYDYIVNDIETLKRVRDFCEGRLKHPLKIIQFEKWKKLFENHYGREGQKELARQQMIDRWKDPNYRLKVLNGIKNRWTTDEKKKQSDRLTNRWAQLKESGKVQLEACCK